MYRWALLQPSESQTLFYMDEIAPFCPPVAKPPAKSGLMLLLRQARKYGLGMVLATQSPGDLDYKGLAQIGTVGLGRIKQQQEIAKVATYLANMPGADVDSLVAGLPDKRPGEFTILCPDHLESPAEIRVRWLTRSHEVLGAEAIAEAVSFDDRENGGEAAGPVVAWAGAPGAAGEIDPVGRATRSPRPPSALIGGARPRI